MKYCMTSQLGTGHEIYVGMFHLEVMIRMREWKNVLGFSEMPNKCMPKCVCEFMLVCVCVCTCVSVHACFV